MSVNICIPYDHNAVWKFTRHCSHQANQTRAEARMTKAAKYAASLS